MLITPRNPDQAPQHPKAAQAFFCCSCCSFAASRSSRLTLRPSALSRPPWPCAPSPFLISVISSALHCPNRGPFLLFNKSVHSPFASSPTHPPGGGEQKSPSNGTRVLTWQQEYCPVQVAPGASAGAFISNKCMRCVGARVSILRTYYAIRCAWRQVITCQIRELFH